jgi:plasmid stability protein
MKNITVTIDEDTYRRARVKAAERDTSVTAMVRQFLTEVVAGESDEERLKREEASIRESIVSFRASDRLRRDALHDRGR